MSLAGTGEDIGVVQFESEHQPASRLRAAGTESGTLRFSFVIANYNYGRYVARAIDSALRQDWPNVEVVVIDDGSSDNSVEVISAFGDRITTIFAANAGQRIANNRAFAASSGDVVVFLDADDVIDPGFARAVASVWREGLSKVQVVMARVDAEERPLGSLVPALNGNPSPAQIRDWAMTTSEYPTPPGSGNAYARSFLETFFPIGQDEDSSTDSTCLALAPLFGEIETIARPLALYRIHGSNDSNLHAAPDRFGREVRRAYVRQASAERACVRHGRPLPDPDCIRRGRHLLQLRVASLRLAPENHPPEAGGRLTLLFDALRSLHSSGPENAGKRLLVAAWTVVTLLAPGPLARALVYRRFGTGR